MNFYIQQKSIIGTPTILLSTTPNSFHDQSLYKKGSYVYLVSMQKRTIFPCKVDKENIIGEVFLAAHVKGHVIQAATSTDNYAKCLPYRYRDKGIYLPSLLHALW